MKLYPLYEFPPNLAELDNLLRIIDLSQPLSKESMENLVGELFGKRTSRTEILIRTLRKLDLVILEEEYSLSWGTQLYLDMKRNIQGLLLHHVYKQIDLFRDCKNICQIDPGLNLSNLALYEKMLDCNYEKENKRTVSEKLYAIKRLIKSCQTEHESNPFIEHEKYIKFIYILEESYLSIVGVYGRNMIIKELEKILVSKGYSKLTFSKYLKQLFKDPILATSTSFSTVSEDFAVGEYISINNDDYYFVKINKNFFE